MNVVGDCVSTGGSRGGCWSRVYALTDAFVTRLFRNHTARGLSVHTRPPSVNLPLHGIWYMLRSLPGSYVSCVVGQE